jgi:hypothetical protein
MQGAQGKLEEALSAYPDGLAIRDNAQWQKDLRHFVERVGR